MKKYCHISLKKITGVMTCLLALLGFTSCIVVAYGTPQAEYIIKGKVTNEKGNAITGIRVEVTKVYRSAGRPYPTDTPDSVDVKNTLTNTKGEYAIILETIGKSDFIVSMKDVDGEANGRYKPSTTEVKDVKLSGSGGWHEGYGEVIVNSTLKEDKE